MAVYDLWYRSKPNAAGKRAKTKRYGIGKRWRVVVEDGSDTPSKAFDRKADAEAYDLEVRSGSVEVKSRTERQQERQTFAEYAERWRTSRQITQALDYQRHTESRLRHHLLPDLGKKRIGRISVTDVLEWIAGRLAAGVAQSSVKTYFDLLNAIMNAALADKVVDDNPCRAVRIGAILRGFSRAPKWVPTSDEVLALLDVVPERFRAAIWLGAGAGLRLGEVLGLEADPRCVEPDSSELHVMQQLRFHRAQYGGFFLAPPKSGSTGDVALDDEVASVIAAHIERYPLTVVNLPDVTRGTPDPGKPAPVRPARLLFTNADGRPIHDQRWSDMWATWRTAAGWPTEGTFHSLRHYFATTLIVNGVDPTDVQHELRHSSLRITLETYVHWWPKKDRRRNIISDVLATAAKQRREVRR